MKSVACENKIYVLVPAYNVASVLNETLDSLLAQTYTDWECFCMDDGSSDGTYEILKRYAQKDSRFHVFHQTNQGVTKASNALLDKIDGKNKYIFFLDSDDCIHPQTFEILVHLQKETNADIMEINNVRFFETKPASYFQKINPKTDIHTIVLTDMSAFLLKRTRKKFGAWINKSKLYVWDKIKNVRFNENLTYEDDYFYNSIIHTLISKKVIVCEPLYYWRVNKHSMTQCVNWTKYQKAGIERIYASYDSFIKEKRVPDALKDEFIGDLTKDAFRMIGMKPVKKCRDSKMRREFFKTASRTFTDMLQKGIIRKNALDFGSRLILRAFVSGHYLIARFLLLFK